VNLSLPFATDCLTQQCQILLELINVGDIWQNLGSSLPDNARSLASGNFQCQQVMFNNMGDSLARRVDLSSKAYAFPCQFVQQKVQIPLINSVSPQPIVLTGFRAGSVSSIQCWLTNNLDNLPPSQRGNRSYNPNKWYSPVSVEMLYAGDIYARYNLGVGTLFNLLNSNKAPAFDMADSVVAGSAYATPVPFLSQWLELPFAQALCDEDAHYILMHGKAITNGIVNLNNMVVPFVSGFDPENPTDPLPAGSGWTCNISFVYSSTLLFSQGSVDYVF